MQGNTAKNRYVDILPFDHTRVKLLPLADEEGSDYINANYIPGYLSKREFIAAQGPLPGTVDHFWRMIWEQNVSVVVMLTLLLEKGKRKCDQYWPEGINESLTYGDLTVTKVAESPSSDYCVRTLRVSLNDYTREVTLLAYMSWPDFGCPQTTDALLNFVAVFRSYLAKGSRGPAIVHCSAGVGRTGTFVCLDRLLQQIKSKEEVDVFATVLEMRDYRTRMVQTEDQYVYIHDCIKDALLRGYSPFYRVEKPSYYGGDDTNQYINFEPKTRPTSRFGNSSRASSSEGLVKD